LKELLLMDCLWWGFICVLFVVDHELCGVDAMKDESEEIGEKESLKDEC
jgi:hypothetical protein